jgi:broad-specificity NMP kinase
MVASLMISGHRPQPSPLLVELVGPAGVGKTTLSRALVGRGGVATAAIWGLPAAALIGNGVRLLPSLLENCRRSGSLLWEESRHMVRLATLQRALAEAKQAAPQVMLFDEGPIFALAWLRGFGHEIMRSDASQAWWQATLRDWAQLMDAVVVVEANDGLLARRIRTRPHDHEVKEFSDAEIVAWMARFRSALSWVLAGLAAEGGPAVLRVTSDREPPEMLADRVGAALDRIPYDD